MKDYTGLEDEIVKCTRCGACQVVCPVFRETGRESTVARGKVRLLKAAVQAEMPIDAEFTERMSLCLMCQACNSACPSGVKTSSLVEAARTASVAKLGLPLLKRLIFRLLLKNPGIFRAGFRLGSVGRKLLFRPHPSGSGVLPRVPLGIDRRRLLQPLAPKTFSQLWQAAQIPGKPSSNGKVGLFTGCMVNYLYVDIGLSACRVLQRNGIEVIYPLDQHCCGTPARVNGDRESAIDMAKANIDVLLAQELETIVTPCASCGLALKVEYPELLAEDPVYGPRAKALAGKVKDFAEFLVTVPGWEKGLGELPGLVTYHDPCHLARGQGIRRQPRALIKGVPAADFVELTPTEQCCGCAGSFSLSHPELSRSIGGRRIDSVERSTANTLVSGCAACLMQLRDGVISRGLAVETLHLAEFLDRSYQKEASR